MKPPVLQHQLWMLALIPIPAFANIAIPTVFITIPAMSLALAPIVIIEAYILCRMISLSYKRSLQCMFIANVVTTVIGMLLSTACHFLIASLIGAFDNLDSDFDRAIVLGAIIMEAPFETSWGAVLAAFIAAFIMCVMSIACEWSVLIKMKLNATKKEIFTACLCANAISYIIIFTWLSFTL